MWRTLTRLAALAFAGLCLAGCGGSEEGGTAHYERAFRANGLSFSEPNLVIKGRKEKGMGFEIWTIFSSDSQRCLGSSVTDSKQNSSFYAGGGSGKAGTARRMSEVLPGTKEYAITIPIKLSDTRECAWRLREIQIQLTDPYVGNRREDLASFILRDEAAMEPLEARYESFCQKRKGLFTRLDCRHGSQNGRNVVAYSRSVDQGASVTIDVSVSDNVLPAQ